MPIRAPRGLIFDREGRPLAVNTPSWTLYARPADLPSADGDRRAVLARASLLSGIGLATIKERLEAFRGSPFELVPVGTEIGRDAALLIAEDADELPGISVGAEPRRSYLDDTGARQGELLAHLVGYTGPVSRGELEAMQHAERTDEIDTIAINDGTGSWAVVIAVSILEIGRIRELPLARAGLRMKAFDDFLILQAVSKYQTRTGNSG